MTAAEMEAEITRLIKYGLDMLRWGHYDERQAAATKLLADYVTARRQGN